VAKRWKLDEFTAFREQVGASRKIAEAALVDSSLPGSPSDARSSEPAQTAKVVVSEQGYEPAKVTLRAGTPARITFVRTTDKTCGTEVVFPSLNIKRSLPLNEPALR
jgi:plastocyanin